MMVQNQTASYKLQQGELKPSFAFGANNIYAMLVDGYPQLMLQQLCRSEGAGNFVKLNFDANYTENT